MNTLAKSISLLVVLAVLATIGFGGCASSGSSSSSQDDGPNVTAICGGSILGGLVIGGIAGRKIGDSAGSKTAGTIIGAAGGGAAGVAICRRAWKQAQALKERLERLAEESEAQEAYIASLEDENRSLIDEVNAAAEVETDEAPLPPPPVADYNLEVIENRAIRFDLNSALLFEVGSSKLQPRALMHLDALAESLDEYPGSRVTVIGHTDDSGSEDLNQRLSEARSESVAAYMTKKGVDGSRLESLGKGESEPAFTNKNPMGRAKNRRVEIVIVPT